MRHPELLTDAAAVLLGISELERGTPPDNFESRELPERGDQILRDPIREVLLVRLTAFVREWQHGDGGGARSNGPRSVESLKPEIPQY